MKKRHLTGLALSLSFVLTGVLSCGNPNTLMTSSSQNNPIKTTLKVQTQEGAIRLNIALPQKKAYPALYRYHGFKTQALEEGRINKIKVTITHVTSDFIAEKVIPLTQSGMVATIKVPLGKNYIITVQGMDDLNEVPGAKVRSVFSVDSSETIPDVDVNPLMTAVANIVETVKTTNPDFAANIDVQKLTNLVSEGKSAASPFLVNAATFADVIVAKEGVVPSIVPPNPVSKPGNISGAITGLEPGDSAIVFSNDPASEPFIVVAPATFSTPTPDPNATTTTTETTAPSFPFRIDNVPPGDWVVRVVASGYKVEGDNIESINELSATKTVTVEANTQSALDFTVKKAGWSSDPTNASNNIGSSDQPDLTVDGSDSIHMVWRQDGFGNNAESGSIFYSRWNGKNWSTDNRFISPAGEFKNRGARNPAVAVGIDRTPHVVWSTNSDNTNFRGRRIAFTRFDGVNWSKPLFISPNSPDSEIEADYPDIAINPVNNQAFAVWNQLESGVKTVFISQLQNGEWLEPIRLSDGTTQAFKPQISVGTDGKIHVVWEVEGTSRVQYVGWDGRVFSAIEEVPFNQGVAGNTVPRNLEARLDLLNRLHLIRRDQDVIQYIFRSNQSWSASEPVHEVNGNPLTVNSHVSLALDNIGNVNAAWGSTQNDGTLVMRYRRRTNAGWDVPGTSPVVVATPSPVVFPTPTPEPTSTPTPNPVASPTASPDLGYEDLPASANKVPAFEPKVAVDSRGQVSVLWSNSGVDPVNSDIFHSIKSEPIVTESTTP